MTMFLNFFKEKVNNLEPIVVITIAIIALLVIVSM